MKLSLDEYLKKYIDKTLTEVIASFHVEAFLCFVCSKVRVGQIGGEPKWRPNGACACS
jgi:hypothetical protein